MDYSNLSKIEKQLSKLSNVELEQLEKQAKILLPISKFHETGLSEHFTEACFLDPNNQPIKLAQLQIEWHKFIRESIEKDRRRLLILSGRSFGKSTNLLGLILYYLNQNLNHRIKIVCSSDELASRRVLACKRIIEQSESFKLLTNGKLEPDNALPFSSHQLYIKREAILLDPSIEGKGVYSSSLGGRCSIMLLDDIVTMENSNSEELRQKLSNHILSNWMPMIDDDGICICIGTTWYESDYYHQILGNKSWDGLVQVVSEDLKYIDQFVT